jgi:hypothetical protein
VAPFKFEIWAPSKDLCKRARTAENEVFGARDPQPADKIEFFRGVGVPYKAPKEMQMIGHDSQRLGNTLGTNRHEATLCCVL